MIFLFKKSLKMQQRVFFRNIRSQAVNFCKMTHISRRKRCEIENSSASTRGWIYTQKKRTTLKREGLCFSLALFFFKHIIIPIFWLRHFVLAREFAKKKTEKNKGKFTNKVVFSSTRFEKGEKLFYLIRNEKQREKNFV